MPSSAGRPEDLVVSFHQRCFGFVLMAIAGWVDACAIVLFSNLFASFQSGDAVQLGTNVAHGQWTLAAKFLGAQVAFVAGAAVGRHVRMTFPRYGRRITLVGNAVLLGCTAIFGHADTIVPAYAFAALAMGAQNATMMHESGVLIGSMVTGSLARLGFAISDRVTGDKSDSDIYDNLAQWLFFVLGALLGAVGFKYLAADAFWVPALACLLLVPLAAKLPRIQRYPFVRAA